MMSTILKVILKYIENKYTEERIYINTDSMKNDSPEVKFSKSQRVHIRKRAYLCCQM